MKRDANTWLVIEALAESDGRYAAYAHNFILTCVEETIATLDEKRHISGPELLEGVRIMAARQFGPMAKEVLNHWGVYTTRDIGNIVFLLIDAGLLDSSEDDSPADFDAVYDFKTVFEEDYYRR